MRTISRLQPRVQRWSVLVWLLFAGSNAWSVPTFPSRCFAQDGQAVARGNLLAPYEQRVANLEAEQAQTAGIAPDSIPADFEPWWFRELNCSLRESTQPLSVDIEGLVMGAIQHSPKIKAISSVPEIRRTAIAEANATFDPQAFAESKLIDTNDPVGNTLTTGGPTRYFDQNVYSDAGVRRKTLWGGQLEVSQRLGYENSNSTYFTPPYQATAKLSLSYTQPLLRGAGRAYNESVVVLAEIDASMAVDEFAGALQDHIWELHRAYWDLYLERVAYLQKRRLCQDAEKVLSDLRARQRLDASRTQVVRAESALATRWANLIRAATSVRNAEAKIQLLVNDPALQIPGRFELVPLQRPCREYSSIDIRQSVLKALSHRPDLDQAIRQIRAASVRADVARNELMPVLNGVVSTYVSGLEGYGQITRAYGDQFSNGGPSYAAGLEFEMPLGNRAAKAHEQRRRMELCQYRCQLDQAVAQIVHDVEIAVREVATSHRETQARYRAMTAAAVEIRALQERWKLLAGEEQVAGLLLEDLLSAQDRLAEAEFEFTTAQVSYCLALASLERATGTLVACQRRSDAAERLHPPAPGAQPEIVPPPPEPGPTGQASGPQGYTTSFAGQSVARRPPDR